MGHSQRGYTRTVTDAVGLRSGRRRFSFVGFLGELLITGGVVVLLFVVWQLWVGDVIYAAQAGNESRDLTRVWAQQYVPPAEPAEPDPETGEIAIPDLAEPADTEDFAVLHVPRFGTDYLFPIAGGVTRAGTLDNNRIGHYPGTSMPGDSGNFALAAHRRTSGGAFLNLPDLRLGDAIVVETFEGWFTYRFRTLEYVTPSAVDVLLPVPQAPEAPAGAGYITLTTCSPMFSLDERLIAYGVFESFTPREAGPPASLTGEVV